MKQKLRYLCTLLLFMVASVGWAEEVTFTFNTDAGLTALNISKPSVGAGTELGDKTYTLGGVSMTATDGGTPTRVWNSNGTLDLRIYKDGGSLTFTATENITSIVISGGSVNSFTANIGDFSSGTWTGAATSVTLTATGTGKINTVKVTTGGTTPVVAIPAPTLSPAAGTVESGTKVTISNFNSNYLYYYTTDRTDPAVDDEGTVENGTAFPTDGLTITSTTTLKVIATDGEGHVSDITSATYTVEQTANYEWVETNLADLTSSDIFVIVGNNGNNYAMSNDKGTSEAPTAVSVTIENGKITSTVSNNIKWSASGNATDGYIFYPNGNTEKWLYCNTTASSGSNNNIRVGVSSRNRFNLNDKDYLVTKDDKTTRYLSIYDNSEWRGYTNTNNGAVALKFYKRVSENEPTLTAFDVEVAYDAASGSISYALENATGGTLSATTTANWLTIGTIGTTVPFTCTTNPNASERIATVTLSYALPSGQTLTATATVTQAANPDVTITIAEARAQGTGDVQTKGVVTSVYGKTAYIQDANAAIAVRGNDDLTVAVGDEIKVSGTLGTYNGLLQIQSPTITFLSRNNTVSPQLMTVAEVNSSTNQGWLVKIEEATVTNIEGQNVTIAQGDNSVVVRFNTTPTGFAVSDKLTLTGNISCYGSTKQIANPTDINVTENVEPIITVDPTSINATYEGEEGNISVTYDNVDTDAIEIVFYTTAEATTTTTCSWIDAIFDEMNNVQYTIAANEGEARTAYMKVHGLDAEGNDVYSDLITINQAAYAVDYAVLPFEWAGGASSDFNALAGVKTYGLGSDYAASNAPYLIKFDNTDDYILVKTDSRPGKVTIGVKMIGGANTSSIKVQGSSDGQTFSDVETLSISGSQNAILSLETSKDFAENDRFVKLVFTKGSNVGVGPITIAKYDASQETVPVSISSVGMATFSSTKALDFTDAGNIYAYTATVDNAGNIAFTRVYQVPAKTGLLLRNPNGESAEAQVPVISNATAVENNALVAVDTEIALASEENDGTKNYILNNGSKGIGFYKAAGKKVGAGKAYLQVPASVTVREFIGFDDETDGIEQIENGQLTIENAEIYNLSGQRVNKAQKGIYIVNGKKVVVK